MCMIILRWRGVPRATMAGSRHGEKGAENGGNPHFGRTDKL